MNSVWIAYLSITEDFSCFFLQVSVWQSPSYLWSLWLQNGCCCFLPHQESFWWLLIPSSASLTFVSPAMPKNQGKEEKGKINKNICLEKLVFLTLILTKMHIYIFFPLFFFLNLQKLIVLVYWDIKTCKQEEKHQFWCYTRS